jgi:hypothetical protein
VTPGRSPEPFSILFSQLQGIYFQCRYNKLFS